MAFHSYIRGTFRCVRCGSKTSECIQTRLFQVVAQTASREYGLGDSVSVDGLADYIQLHPHIPGGPLHVIIGDWNCDNCGLNFQWAALKLGVSDDRLREPFTATIDAVEDFVPVAASSFASVNYIQEEFASLGGYPGSYIDSIEVMRSDPPDQKVARLLNGYRKWSVDMKIVGARN